MREVQCIICDRKVFIDENALEAKRLLNNPIKTFMCDECKSRLDSPKQRPNNDTKYHHYAQPQSSKKYF